MEPSENTSKLQIQSCAYDALMKRQLFMLELGSADEVLTIDLPARHFGCFIAWDSRKASHEQIARFVDLLIKAGSVYFVCWGPDCERVPDIVDECDPFRDPDSAIMTTWHDGESLNEGLWIFLNNTMPAKSFEKSFSSSLAISVGSSSWATNIRSALQDPRGFSSHMLEASDAGT